MAKYSGTIGFLQEPVETAPSVYEDVIVERIYKGLLLQSEYKNQNDDSVNTDFKLSNRISIIADPFARNNFHTIVFVEFRGAKWTVTSAKENYPRIVLTLGGVYNG